LSPGWSARARWDPATMACCGWRMSSSNMRGMPSWEPGTRWRARADLAGAGRRGRGPARLRHGADLDGDGLQRFLPGVVADVCLRHTAQWAADSLEPGISHRPHRFKSLEYVPGQLCARVWQLRRPGHSVLHHLNRPARAIDTGHLVVGSRRWAAGPGGCVWPGGRKPDLLWRPAGPVPARSAAPTRG